MIPLLKPTPSNKKRMQITTKKNSSGTYIPTGRQTSSDIATEAANKEYYSQISNTNTLNDSFKKNHMGTPFDVRKSKNMQQSEHKNKDGFLNIDETKTTPLLTPNEGSKISPQNSLEEEQILQNDSFSRTPTQTPRKNDSSKLTGLTPMMSNQQSLGTELHTKLLQGLNSNSNSRANSGLNSGVLQDRTADTSRQASGLPTLQNQHL